jgi:hypothetical protein
MGFPERIAVLAAPILGVTSVLLLLAGGNLFFAAWLFATRHQAFWASFWAVGGTALVAYALLSLLDLEQLIAAPAMALLRPLLRLGAVALALAGAAWPVMTVIRWRQTGDLEAYGVVIGLIMLAHGIAAFVWLARPRAAGA